uniref:Major sperm protein n=1 Tax=Parastrongyloides trichosuri TaxID=131310 RepID=A0A0N4Z5U5_PARTI
MFVSNYFDIPSLDQPYQRCLLLRNTLNESVIYKIRQSCQLSLKITPTIGEIGPKSTKLITIKYLLGFKKLINNSMPKHFDIYVRVSNTKKDNKDRTLYSWLKNEIVEPNHLAHRFILTEKFGYISSIFVFDIPCKAAIIEPILFPVDFIDEPNCRTAIQIDKDTIEGRRIISYPKELAYMNYNNDINENNNYYEQNKRGSKTNVNDLPNRNDSQYSYQTTQMKNEYNGILTTAINYLFGYRNDNEDSIYMNNISNKRQGFIC